MRQAPRTVSLSWGTVKGAATMGAVLRTGINEPRPETPQKCEVASYLQACRGMLQSRKGLFDRTFNMNNVVSAEIQTILVTMVRGS